jgi:phenylalanyl-tRNA synthetase alpha chain
MSIQEKIDQYSAEINQFTAAGPEDAEAFRLKFLVNKGIVRSLFEEFKTVSVEEKRVLGQVLNQFKQLAESKHKDMLEQLSEKEGATAGNEKDLTLPGNGFTLGSRHPLSLVRKEIIEIFIKQGFIVAEGPEIEDDWHNFEALNFPAHHPARDMQDTFFVQMNPDYLLRTHTSSVQVRYMENNQPPIRTISPGRVFRNEAISSRSHCIFHQVEGLYIDKDVSFADLKQTLQYFTTQMFGKSKIRLRPSYFPFTEPSAEIDVYWGLNTETDYRITKGTGWLEIGGCGMVDPNVLENCKIDSKEYSGFAFGMGIDRIAMLLHQIGDIRLLSENDIRFLEQFKSSF